MSDLHTGEGGFVSQKHGFVSKHFGIACLDKQRRQTFHVSKQRTRIGMGEILGHAVWSEEARDRVEMIAGYRYRNKIEFGIAIPRIATHRQIYPSGRWVISQSQTHAFDSPTQGDISIEAAGRGKWLSRR